MRDVKTGLLHALCGLLLIASGGCRSSAVRTDSDAAIDFAIFESYGWLSPPETPPAAPNDAIVPTNELQELRVESAIDAQLRARGLPHVAEVDADLLVAAHVIVGHALWISTTMHGLDYDHWSVHMGAHDRTLVAPYDEGTLVIDFVDPVERRLVWRGVGRVQLRDGGTPLERETRVRATAAAILDGFPPRSPR